MKEGMIDNRKVKDDHQQGIERVKNIKMPTGQPGRMPGHMGNKGGKDGFRRDSNAKLTPRKG